MHCAYNFVFNHLFKNVCTIFNQKEQKEKKIYTCRMTEARFSFRGLPILTKFSKKPTIYVPTFRVGSSKDNQLVLLTLQSGAFKRQEKKRLQRAPAKLQ